MSEDPHKSILKIPHYRLLMWIFLATIFAWLSWLLVLYKLDPYESAYLSLTPFFFSFTLALSGTFTGVLFFIKKWWSDGELYVKHVTISLRQGVLLSLCTNLCLALLMLGLLRVWNGLLLVILMTLLEFYLSGKDDLN